MEKNQVIASIHRDYLPFVELASDAELAQFVRAQIAHARGEDADGLTGMASALYAAHIALVERLDESRRKKSEAGRRGGNPTLKQCEAEVKQCLSTAKAEVKQCEAEVKPNTVSNSSTVSNTVDSLCPPCAGAREEQAEAPSAACAEFLNRVNPAASKTALELLAGYARKMTDEVCIRAMDIALDERKASWSYIHGILQRWASDGVKCLADVDRREAEHRAQKDAAPVKQYGRRGAPPPVSDEERDKVARDELAALRRIIGQEDTG